MKSLGVFSNGKIVEFKEALEIKIPYEIFAFCEKHLVLQSV